MSGRTVWASRVVTPEGVIEGARLILEDGRIRELMPAREPAPADDSYRDATLLPGLVDLQVNGADGAAYDAAASEERARATAYHVARGTTSLLATLVSAPLPRLQAALERAAPDVDPAGPVVGLHLEGPFLAAAKSGAHTLDALVDPTPAAVDGLIARAAGALRMVTLAPELPGALDAVARFARAGAVVAAGHSQASTEELRAAVSQGLDFVTHVGNASDWPSRPYDDSQGFRRSEPGLVGTFLFEPRLRGSLILDGFHLHPELARAIVELRGADSVVLVSDATPAAGLPAGRYQMGGLDAEIHAEGYATAGEGLAGSVITLLDAVRIAVERAGIALATAVRMASATPAHVIGVDGRKGALAPGRDADLLVVGSEWDVRAVYRLGEPV